MDKAKFDQSEEDELKEYFGGEQERVKNLLVDSEPSGHLDLDNTYNQVQVSWRERGATGFEGNTRMKEMFVNTEYLIEKEYGKDRIEAGGVNTYKGTTKKW
jgi:hypothetical protein